MNKTSSSTPTAGKCPECGVWTNQRYGGEGHYPALCWKCWSRGGVSPSGKERP